MKRKESKWKEKRKEKKEVKKRKEFLYKS